MFQRSAEWRLVSGQFHADFHGQFRGFGRVWGPGDETGHGSSMKHTGFMPGFKDLGGFEGQGMKPGMKPARNRHAVSAQCNSALRLVSCQFHAGFMACFQSRGEIWG